MNRLAANLKGRVDRARGWGLLWRRGSSLGAAITVLALVLAATAWATAGALTQKAGTAGCISETGTVGTCADGRALAGADSVTISPDGKNAYVASHDDGVAVFDRDPATGKLTQKPGTDACISEDGSGHTCADGRALNTAVSITSSPDGRSVYVVTTTPNAVAVFDRNPVTGKLTQKAGTDGCISETGSGGTCADGKALYAPSSVAVSPNGRNVYVASFYSSA